MADDETNMDELEKSMRGITMDGLVWGASKRVPVGYGIFKLQVNLVVEDEKVSLEELQGKIEEDEDHVQSTDIVSSPRLSLQSFEGASSESGVRRTNETRLLCKSCNRCPLFETSRGMMKMRGRLYVSR